MIGSTHRFHGRTSLRFVYQNGKTVRGSVLSVKYALNERRRTYRTAVVVGKKVSKSAVVRNRIRRRIYEIIRAHETEITKPFDIVVTVFHEQAATMPAEDLQKTLQGLLKQANMIL